jgi:glucan 1,3-beta-glucosidase
MEHRLRFCGTLFSYFLVLVNGNFLIDTTAASPRLFLRAIHWPTGQATSLQNIVFKLFSAYGTQHEGLFIEDGSGGFVTDLEFYGGNIGKNLELFEN